MLARERMEGAGSGAQCTEGGGEARLMLEGAVEAVERMKERACMLEGPLVDGVVGSEVGLWELGFVSGVPGSRSMGEEGEEIG